jgi:hypothetical protein
MLNAQKIYKKRSAYSCPRTDYKAKDSSQYNQGPVMLTRGKKGTEKTSLNAINNNLNVVKMLDLLW